MKEQEFTERKDPETNEAMVPEDPKKVISGTITKRELQVLELISQGLTSKEIAEKIFLSRRTVEAHRKNLMDKTKSRNCSALIRHAIFSGILRNTSPVE